MRKELELSNVGTTVGFKASSTSNVGAIAMVNSVPMMAAKQDKV